MKFWCFIYVLAIIIISSGTRIAAETPAEPATSIDCSDLIFDMVDCISFLVNGPSDPMPSPACCTGFEHVFNSDADCVCDGLKNADEMGISINITKAGTLAELCHVNAPSISNCYISTAPAPSPVESAASSPRINSPKPEPGAGADSPPAAPVTPPPKSSGTSTMPMFVVSSFMVVASLLV